MMRDKTASSLLLGSKARHVGVGTAAIRGGTLVTVVALEAR